MNDLITVTGFVATIPNHVMTGTGLPITTFRLASTARRFDRQERKWVDGETNWFTVTAFRNLALNAAGSVEKGQRVIVRGRLKVRPWTKEERTGTNVEIDAESLGHDLAWGTARYTRNLTSNQGRDDSAQPAPEVEGEGSSGPQSGEPQWASAPLDAGEPGAEPGGSELVGAGAGAESAETPF